MIEGSVDSKVAALNRTIAEYLEWTSKDRAHALEHQAQKMRWAIYRGFRGIRAEKGSIREAARQRGWRTEIRPSVRKRVEDELAGRDSKRVTVAGRRVTLNKRALMTHRELSLRERGSGYLGVSWMFRGWGRADDPRAAKFFAKGRAGGRLAQVSIRTTDEPPRIRIVNTVPGVAAVEENRQIIGRAVDTVNEDIQQYILSRTMREARRRIRRVR